MCGPPPGSHDNLKHMVSQYWRKEGGEKKKKTRLIVKSFCFGRAAKAARCLQPCVFICDGEDVLADQALNITNKSYLNECK